MEEFIIGRSKSHQEIENQINRLAEKFQQLERNQVPMPEESEFQEVEDLDHYSPESDDSGEVGIPPIVNHPQKKEERKRSLLR